MTRNNPAFPILGPARFNTDSRLFPLLLVRHLSSGEGWAVLLYGWRLPPELSRSLAARRTDLSLTPAAKQGRPADRRGSAHMDGGLSRLLSPDSHGSREAPPAGLGLSGPLAAVLWGFTGMRTAHPGRRTADGERRRTAGAGRSCHHVILVNINLTSI